MQFNKVYNIDFLNNTLPDKCANLIIADPPYFEVKGAFDFVWEDMKAYLQDVEKWAKECKRLLADNGTLFWYGHAKKIAYSQVILDDYFTLENNIAIEFNRQTKKGVENFRCFAPVSERLLMYSLDEYNLKNCTLHIRDYIRSEILKSKGKISFKYINKALGTATNGGGVASACLSLEKAEPAMMTKEMYQKLQACCSPYLNKDYELLRADYELLRRPFNNYLKLYDIMKFDQEAHITGKYDHDTCKPETLSRALILTCSRPNDLVLVPFAGSGTECAMAAKERRRFIGFDIEPKYVEMANKRVKDTTAQIQIF
jgi:DNA modification methylase